jgi:hypothetical protein
MKESLGTFRSHIRGVLDYPLENLGETKLTLTTLLFLAVLVVQINLRSTTVVTNRQHLHHRAQLVVHQRQGGQLESWRSPSAADRREWGVIAATGMILHLKVVLHRVEFGVLQRPDPSSVGMLIAITSATRSEAPVEAIAPATGIKAPNSTTTGQATYRA